MGQTVKMPKEPPDDLPEIYHQGKFTTVWNHFDEILFNLCRDDDYRGIYREFVRRYGDS